MLLEEEEEEPRHNCVDAGGEKTAAEMGVGSSSAIAPTVNNLVTDFLTLKICTLSDTESPSAMFSM